jgi:hypothetical protein
VLLGSVRLRFTLVEKRADDTQVDALDPRSGRGQVALRWPRFWVGVALSGIGILLPAGLLRSRTPSRWLTFGGLSAGGALFAAAVLWRFAVAAHSKPAQLEPAVLGGAAIEASFGIGEGVTYAHDDGKAFELGIGGTGPAVAVLHYQSRDISDGEVEVVVNGQSIGTVPADGLAPEQVLQEMLIRPELLQNGQNRIEFRRSGDRPRGGEGRWRIWNIWVEVSALPQVPSEELLHEAWSMFRRAEQNFERRDIALPNRYSAWKDYRNAWLMLLAMPDPKPELFLRAQERMRDAQRELDRVCSALLLGLQRSFALNDARSAQAIFDDVKAYFPGGDQRCVYKAEQKRAELKL